MTNFRTRFAPTPSGFLHIGNVLNFTKIWLAAHQNQGKILLRIDDLDAERKRTEFVEDIFRTLDWLGFDWHEGPFSVDDFEKNWSQTLRLSEFNGILENLKKQNLLFACRKSRKDLAVFEGNYPKIWQNQGISLDEKDAALRIKTPENFEMSNFVVRRRDGIAAYQIASIADDILFKMTHVIRGKDLANSTNAQIYIAEKANLTEFLNIKFAHHEILKNASGEKLSKSAGAHSVKSLRENGTKPADLLTIFEPHFEKNEIEILADFWKK